MTENKEYWSSLSDRGNVKISEDVVSTIVSVAVLETEGVSNIVTSVTSDIASLLGKKVNTKGTKVTFNYDDVEVELSILVQFGNSVFDIAKNVQDNVKIAIESMTGLKCSQVHVNITGITFEK